ncbi:phosphatase PAP2 family protein [Pontibacter aydingkolensis]|uniref:Phosphatase PAP2 family protein n=1 Tax=Pontibacter aydingkolensis TaxID=1911536 RepID=A0ABS7CPP3_9BACT|nr:phosphatase PAP2 family protein [Pontibacter aydingkolensis]
MQLWLLLAFASVTCVSGQAPVMPYKTNWVKDGAIMAGGIGASVAGNILITNKRRLTEDDLRRLSPADVNRLDRFVAGNYSRTAELTSDFPFYGSFLTPLLLLLDDDVKQNAPQVYLLYGQAMSIAGGMYSMTAGLTRRKRPYIYTDDAPIALRTDKQATNSFYAGHTAATATAAFFVAKVYHDFNPDSPARIYLWSAAAALPVAVGYLRMRAGKHFLSDNIIGYTVGASIGILVPELHKRARNSNANLFPVTTPAYRGAMLTYSF